MTQTVWAPRHVGKELRLSRLGAFDAALGAIRADAEAQAAYKVGDHDRADRHQTLATSYRALRDHYQQQEQTHAAKPPTRHEGTAKPPLYKCAITAISSPYVTIERIAAGSNQLQIAYSARFG